MGKVILISTTTERARCTRRTSGHTSKPTLKRSPRRSALTNGKRDKLIWVDMWDQATVGIGGFSELMRVPRRSLDYRFKVIVVNFI